MADLGAFLVLMGVGCLIISLAEYLTQNTLQHTESATTSNQANRHYRTNEDRIPKVMTMASGKHGDFQSARVGQTIMINHPVRGSIGGKIIGSIKYTELWQRVKNPSEPWVPTGNQFSAYWLDSNLLMYEWKDQLFALDQFDSLTDNDIATKFLPYAKQFGASNETADITFTYPPSTWKIYDIGKFNVANADGSGLRLSAGDVGRFIHANGPDNRVLVIEDYQSGGSGNDTAWNGYLIEWDDIQSMRKSE